jgi:adenosine deaminase
VIEEFAADGVRYLELRTTPRANADKGMTKHSYLQAVIQAIEQQQQVNIKTRLIISIDRRNTLEEAQETVDLALHFQQSSNVVVGVDLCGDVMKGSFLALKPAFERARQQGGFKLTLHFNEVAENIPEAPELLSIRPDRLGHATLLDEYSRTTVYQQAIPVEICMTSNVFSKTVATYEDHHVKQLLEEDHPFILCVSVKNEKKGQV